MPKSKMLNISPSLNQIVIFLPVPAICINIQPRLLLRNIKKYAFDLFPQSYTPSWFFKRYGRNKMN